MSKKLKSTENHTNTERKLHLAKNKNVNINAIINKDSPVHSKIYFSQHEDKAKKLKNINQLKRKYTFFGKTNKTIS